MRRVLVAAALLLLLAAGYGAWRFAHPPMPTGTRTLPVGAAPAGQVTVRFFGATTLAFGDGRDTVLVDALLSRAGLRQVLFGRVGSEPATVAALLHRAGIARASLLLVSHSHYDHVVDAAAVAALTGATVVGSPSTRAVALGGGLAADRIVAVGGGERLRAGAFTVTVVRSRHSPDDRVPGAITAPLRQPAAVKDFREGGTFAFFIEHQGLRIVVHASAGFTPGMYRGVRADAVLLATGGLSGQPTTYSAAYWREVVEATGAKLVVPIHWDDFLQPLDRPLQPLRRFMDDIPLTMHRLTPLAGRDGVTVRYLPVIAPVDLGAAVRAAAR